MTDETQDAPEEGVEPDTPVAPERILPEDALLRDLAERFEDAEFELPGSRSGPEHDVVMVPAGSYHGLVEALRDAGFDYFIDLCGVDYLRRSPRYEVVVNLLSHGLRRRIRVRVPVGTGGDTPHLPSIIDVFAGANFYERETFDLFGVVFDGHTDLTRILLPDEWEGHPLRKDYAVGSVPVQFKGAHHAK